MPYIDYPALPYAPQSDTSRDAAVRAHRYVGPQGIKVMRWFIERGARGGTQREASEALGISRAAMCARVRALEQSGAIFKSVIERRGGCSVYYLAAR